MAVDTDELRKLAAMAREARDKDDSYLLYLDPDVFDALLDECDRLREAIERNLADFGHDDDCPHCERLRAALGSGVSGDRPGRG